VRSWIAEALIVTAALALSAWVSIDDVLPGEARALREVQAWSYPGERLSDIVRGVTTTWVVLVTGYAAAALLWIAGARREAVALALVLLVLPFAQAFIKDAVDRPRPPPDEFDVRASVTSESFPSGHVMSPTVLYVFLLAVCVRDAWWPASARLLVVAWSLFVLATTGIVNVWLGVHWPSDVVGGYLWGLALVLPAIVLATPTRRTPARLRLP
jgi:undecaprenyl-diphosphatase